MRSSADALAVLPCLESSPALRPSLPSAPSAVSVLRLYSLEARLFPHDVTSTSTALCASTLTHRSRSLGLVSFILIAGWLLLPRPQTCFCCPSWASLAKPDSILTAGTSGFHPLLNHKVSERAARGTTTPPHILVTS